MDEQETGMAVQMEQENEPEAAGFPETGQHDEVPGAEGTQEPAEEEMEDAAQSKPWRTEENAAAAARRREAAAERRARMFREFVGEELCNPDTGKPFADETEWMDWRKKAELATAAQQSGAQDVDSFAAGYRQAEQSARKSLMESDPEIAAMRSELEARRRSDMRRAFDADMQAIRKAYPDEQAKSVTELGEDFIRMRAAGVDNLVAYAALRGKDTQDHNPTMGDVKTGQREKTLYSVEEVEKMSQAEVSKNLDTIMKSMKTWK